MEVHPVPKNILTVEFKLFGGLTVRQFVKIVVACALGVFIFITPFPKLVTVPISLAIVAFGVASALANGFATKAITFLKALFISPRYVWKKTDKPSTLLDSDKVAQKKAELTVKNASSQEIGVSLDRLLELRNNNKQQALPPNQTQPVDNFSRLYAAEFSGTTQRSTSPTPANPKTIAEAAALPAGMVVSPGVVLSTQPVGNVNPRATLSKSESSETNTVNSTVESLKKELATISSLPAEQQEAKKQEILSKINTLYAQLNQTKQITTQEQTKLFKQASTRPIFGIVVNAKNQSIAGAIVQILDEHALIIGEAVTREDGKFATEIPDLPGNYIIEISANGFKFPQYRVAMTAGKLPAYKFRSE